MGAFEAAEELIRATDDARETINAGLDPNPEQMRRAQYASKRFEEEMSGEPLRR